MASEFTTNDCGKHSGAATGSLPVGSEVSINGSTDLSGCIVGDSEAKVFGIRLVPNAGIYSYQVQVDAQGPSGVFSGSLHLSFTDETNDTYNLAITSSRRSAHTVSYNSNSPTIVKIAWRS